MAAYVGEFIMLSELMDDTETDEENDTFVIVCTVVALMYEFIMVSINYTPRERSSGGYIEITLSVRLSVQIRVRPITFLWFDIGLPYLAHGCINRDDVTRTFMIQIRP